MALTVSNEHTAGDNAMVAINTAILQVSQLKYETAMTSMFSALAELTLVTNKEWSAQRLKINS